jgi:hypothetical protein
MSAQSQTATVGTSASTFNWTPYYSTIVVTNPSSASLFVRSDGNLTSGLSGNYAGWQQIPPTSTGVLLNQLPLPNANSANVLGNLADTAHATQVQVAASTGTVQATVLVQ